MDSNRGEELSTSILEYQNNVIRVAHHRLRTQVTPTDKRHVSALSYIWLQARITDAPAPSSTSRTPPLSPTPSQTNGRSEESSREVDRSSSAAGPGSRLKWRRLGFATESVAKEFGRTGWLGLECLEAFVRTDPEAYAKVRILYRDGFARVTS